MSDLPSRAAIEAIRERVELDLKGLLVEEEHLTPEETQAKFDTFTEMAQWEAIYTLADHIDRLRS
jgi:hypothetical protein